MRETFLKLRMQGAGKPATEAYFFRRMTETEGPRPAFGPRHGGANGGDNAADGGI